jgi:hypothetical protein
MSGSSSSTAIDAAAEAERDPEVPLNSDGATETF